MRKFIIVSLLLVSFASHAQRIQLSKKSFSTYKNGPAEIVADSIIVIANAVLNSPDFKDSISNLTFNNKDNNCKCNNDVIMTGSTIKGKDIYNHLFRNTNVAIDMLVKQKSKSSLGSTPICTIHITSYKENVEEDMPEISLAAALAVNICHEYFHSLGYCHTYDNLVENDRRADGNKINWKVYREDVTYRIGWIAFDILNRWINAEQKKYPFAN